MNPALKSVVGVFVERVAVERVAPRLELVDVNAGVTVVNVDVDERDATDIAAALKCNLVKLGESEVDHDGRVLLLVSGESEPAYRALIVAELRERHEVEVLVVGEGGGGLPLSRPGLLRRNARRSDLSRLSLRAGELLGERGQAAITLVATILLTFVGVSVFAQYGGAFVARGRDQRTADLAATAAANRMAKDYLRAISPATLPNGAPNPSHLTSAVFRARARAAAMSSAAANRAGASIRTVRFNRDPAPTSVTVATARTRDVNVAGDSAGRVSIRASATAELRFSFDPLPDPSRTHGDGGGYSGPLAYRQGKAMRPDVAAAFDRMDTRARAAGHDLTINSGFRSDAEQARLFAQRPDPKWVAPPGTSLHRYGTELDLGPPAAYAWLAAHAQRFGFIKRYAWEPWHYGFGANPRDVPAQYERGSFEPGGGSFVGVGGMPSWVPQRFRGLIARAAQRHNVQPVLLAAQLRAESNFNPNAVSSAGAKGIAQFMPETAASVGLQDPFDPAQAIEAQARLMGVLIRQFRSIQKALAAYNAGPGAVQRYRGVPPYAETQAYVARILALIKGAGAELDDPAFAGISITPKVVLVR